MLALEEHLRPGQLEPEQGLWASDHLAYRLIRPAIEKPRPIGTAALFGIEGDLTELNRIEELQDV